MPSAASYGTSRGLPGIELYNSLQLMAPEAKKEATKIGKAETAPMLHYG